MFVRFGGGLKRSFNHPHLGAVTVNHSDLVAFLNKVYYGSGRYPGRRHLLFQVIPEGVPTQGNDYTLFHTVKCRLLLFLIGFLKLPPKKPFPLFYKWGQL
jgi:hypothetical protein